MTCNDCGGKYVHKTWEACLDDLKDRLHAIERERDSATGKVERLRDERRAFEDQAPHTCDRGTCAASYVLTKATEDAVAYGLVRSVQSLRERDAAIVERDRLIAEVRALADHMGRGWGVTSHDLRAIADRGGKEKP